VYEPLYFIPYHIEVCIEDLLFVPFFPVTRLVSTRVIIYSLWMQMRTSTMARFSGSCSGWTSRSRPLQSLSLK